MPTPDDSEWLFKVVVSGAVAVLYAAGSWVVKTTVSHASAKLLTDKRVEDLEAKVAQQAEERLTIEDVREVIDDSLDRRDKAVLERRQQYDEIHRMQVKDAVKEEIERAIPRIAREIRGTTAPPAGGTPG